MLSVGEEAAVIRSLVDASDGGSTSRGAERNSMPRKTEGEMPISIVMGRSWGVKAMGVSISAVTSAPALPSSPSPPGS